MMTTMDGAMFFFVFLFTSLTFIYSQLPPPPTPTTCHHVTPSSYTTTTSAGHIQSATTSLILPHHPPKMPATSLILENTKRAAPDCPFSFVRYVHAPSTAFFSPRTRVQMVYACSTDFLCSIFYIGRLRTP